MTLSRRILFALAAAGAGLPSWPGFAEAETYPSRPVHLIADLPPGLAPDVLARRLRRNWRRGWARILSSRTSRAPAAISAPITSSTPRRTATRSLVMISGNAANAALYPNLGFDFVRDIVPVAFLGYTPFVVVVHPSIPVKTLAELIAYAKANPGKLNLASQGAGTAPHLAFELFRMMTGVNIVHVPYRASYMPDLLAGQVQLAFATVPPVLGYIHNGKLAALGVTSVNAMEALPDVPPIGERCRATRAAAGPASARRTARRAMSWRRSTRPSMPRWPIRRCARAALRSAPCRSR